jgi:hypothetical protein
MGAPIAAARTPGESVIPLLLLFEMDEIEDGVRDVICGVSAVFDCEVLAPVFGVAVLPASSEVNVLSHFVTKVVV